MPPKKSCNYSISRPSTPTSYTSCSRSQSPKSSSSTIEIYTDGSALANSKTSFAGAAFYVPSTKTLRAKGLLGTNNIAELSAIDYALWYSIQQKYTSVIIYSDSQYAINVVTGKYKATANEKLITRIKTKMEQLTVSFRKVAGHKGIEENEIVDKAARMAALRLKKLAES